MLEIPNNTSLLHLTVSSLNIESQNTERERNVGRRQRKIKLIMTTYNKPFFLAANRIKYSIFKLEPISSLSLSNQLPKMENSSTSSTAAADSSTTNPTNNSENPPRANATPPPHHHQFQNTLKSLNKSSYKISKPTPLARNPNPSNPLPPPPPPPPPSNPNPNPNPQPPVYNIDKSDFREIVQKLTGSPAHRQPPPPPAAAAPPPPPPPAATSRLHRIRPPPLSNLSNLPTVGPTLSPLPPLPTVSGAAAESPITAYMRRLRGGPSPAPPLSPLGFGCHGIMLSPSSLLPPTSPRMPLSSPR